MTADITLRGPGDVVGLLPYQLGYHPRDSVVAVSLRGKRVGLVARADLPPDEHVDEVVSTLLGPLVRDGATSVVVVGYEDVPDASQPLLMALVEQLERAGIHVLDVPVVRDGRRYSATCSDSCCPPEGIALPDPADVPGVAEYVGMGRAPLRSRGAVHGLVEPEQWRCEGVCGCRGGPRLACAGCGGGRPWPGPRSWRWGRQALVRPIARSSPTWRSAWRTCRGVTG